MSQHVFTYGSLMFAPVWERVVSGRYRSLAAELSGYRRLAIVGESYPGIVDAKPGKVAGVLYCDVSAADLQALDDFEGSDYRRCSVAVTMPDGMPILAQTYVYLLPLRLATHDWDPGAFPLERFMATYCHDRLGDQVAPAPDLPV